VSSRQAAVQKNLAEFFRGDMLHGMSTLAGPLNRGRAFAAIFVCTVFLWAVVLSASPQLHARIHANANRLEHVCAVTFVSAGQYEHSLSALIICAPAPAFEFCGVTALHSVWLQPILLAAHIFANAPPAVC
jgi:hypothetical protein